MIQQLRISLLMLAMLTLVTGVLYPAAVTVIAQLAFPHQANGSIFVEPGHAGGSELIGQSFSLPENFWGRLSATAPVPYNAASSSGSNYGPLHADLVKNAAQRIADLKKYDPELKIVPVDLVTSSASGLDPHISPAAAEVQVARVARARGLAEADVRELVRKHTLGRQWSILGEPRVNFFLLNRDLKLAVRK